MKTRLLIAALALVACTAHAAPVPSCSWDAPGANPYRGSVPDAVLGYGDIPAATRDALRQRMLKRQYDEVVTIRRDSITGAREYAPDITGMHFGSAGRVCSVVTRDKWKTDATERGLVYCEGDVCVLVPTVCNNVSRITRLPVPVAPPAGPVGGDVPSGGGSPTFAQLVQPVAPPVPLPLVNGPGPTPFYVMPLPIYYGGGCCWSPYVPPVIEPHTPAVPEPGALWLVLAGLAAMWAVTRRRAL